ATARIVATAAPGAARRLARLRHDALAVHALLVRAARMPCVTRVDAAPALADAHAERPTGAPTLEPAADEGALADVPRRDAGGATETDLLGGRGAAGERRPTR